MSDPVGEDVARTYSLDSEHDSVHSSSMHSFLAGQQSPSEASESEDEDLWLAKEMARVITQNPSLSPAELRELQDSKAKERTKQKSKPAFRELATTTTTTTTTKESTASPTNTSPAPVPAPVPPVSEKTTTTTTITAVSPPEPIKTDVSKSQPDSGKNSGGGGGDMGENKTKQRRQSSTKADDDDSVTQKNMTTVNSSTKKVVGGENQIRLSGIVWKRRSGLGKYSATAAWERRRIELKGDKLSYYTNLSKGNDDDSDDDDDDDDNDPAIASSSSAVGGGGGTAATDDNNSRASGIAVAGSWLESGLKMTTDLLAAGGVTAPAPADGARGYCDLVKERVSVGASFGHSGAPTPFAISIKVLTQTKWKFCFDTQGEMMQWMAALTDVVVQASVDEYNSLLLQANDPRYAGESSYGQLSEPPLISNRSEDNDEGGHQLWTTGHYHVKSENFPEEINIIEGEMVLSDEDDDEKKTTGTKRENPLAMTLDPESGTEVFTVPEELSLPFCVFINMAIIFARASATSVEAFWYILAFTNVAFFVLVSKDRVGMEVSKPRINSKMAKRLSAVLGIRIKPTVEDEEVDGDDSSKEKEQQKRKRREISKPSKAYYKPPAGSTAMKIENHNDLPVNEDGHIFAGWTAGDPSRMPIRSHGYKVTKEKVPSPGELYQCVHCDFFDGPRRYPDMSSRVELPKASFIGDPSRKTWHSPDIFVISISVPTDTPKLYSTSEDGMGYTLCMYFVMNQETRDILKRVTADGYNPAKEPEVNDIQKSKVNAVRLFEEWCRRAPTDDTWMSRFKLVPNGHNLEEIGLPTWIAKYNGKPFLIKRPGTTGFLYRHPEKSCMEFDVSLHPFPYLAKQGICFMKDTYFKKVLLSLGFVIEGRSDDELPECLLGLMTLCYPDPVHAIQAEDFFAGKCPKSH